MRLVIWFFLLVVIATQATQAAGQIPRGHNGKRPDTPVEMILVIIREPVLGSPHGVTSVPAVAGKGLAAELGLSAETLEKVNERYAAYSREMGKILDSALWRINKTLTKAEKQRDTERINLASRRKKLILAEILDELNLDKKRIRQACYEKLWREHGLRYCLSLKWMQEDLGITEDEMSALAPKLDKLQSDMEVELRASSVRGWDHEHWHTIRLDYEPEMFALLGDEAKKKAIDIFGIE